MPHGHSNWHGLSSFAAGFWLQDSVSSRLIIMCSQHRKQRCFQPTPSQLLGLRSSEMSSTPPALCSASCSTMTCSFFCCALSPPYLMFDPVPTLPSSPPPLFFFRLLGSASAYCYLLHAATQSSCLVAAAACQQFQHSLRTVTIAFCWGAFAWHSLTYVQLLTSQTCLLPCVVWVKRRDSVCHSTRRQPLLHLHDK